MTDLDDSPSLNEPPHNSSEVAHATPASAEVPESRMPLRAWLAEVVRGVGARPVRVAFTLLGVVLGTATLVAVLGLTTSAQGQVSDRFSILRATEVSVVPRNARIGVAGFSEDATQRVSRLAGVNSVGVLWELQAPQWQAVSADPPGDRRRNVPEGITVFAVGPGLLEASKAQVTSGRAFDDFCFEHACQTVILGTVAAQRLGIVDPKPGQAIFIDGQPFLVQGVLDDTQRNTPMLGGVLIPQSTAVHMWGKDQRQNARMTIDTQIGAATVVGEQVALALRAAEPEIYEVTLPPDPRTLQNTVTGDLSSLFLALAAITVVVGAFGIANVTTVAVMERIPEIGLRRALGARRAHIAAQFVGESSFLGLLGGLFGTPLGIVTVLIVCLARQWTAIMPGYLMLTPLLGLAVGFFAGLYPAWRAAQVEPVSALQQ